KITALFWQESNAAQGRASLRGTLAYIREALREAAGEGGHPPHLITDRETLRFNLEANYELDLELLEAGARLARQPQTLVSSAELAQRLGVLQAAAQVVRGEFLEGFSLSDAPDFDDWVSLQREV